MRYGAIHVPAARNSAQFKNCVLFDTINTVQLSLSESPAFPHRSSLGRLVDQSTVLLMLSIGSLILMLALLILFHQNSNATKGYQLRNLERERSRLLMQQEVLNMQVARSQAMEKIESDHQIQKMVQIKRPEYTSVAPDRISDLSKSKLLDAF